MFKKIMVSAVLIVASMGIAQAANPQINAGAIVVGGVATGFAGSVEGKASSISQGSSVAASQVNGFGTSVQRADGFSGGTAMVGGAVNSLGSTVITNTTHFAGSNGSGSVNGNAPIQVGESIANGNASFGSTDVKANGKSQFATGTIGGVIAVGGFSAIGSN